MINAMIAFSTIMLVCCAIQIPDGTDYALGVHRQAWLRHPVYGAPSFDAFERLPGNPVVVGKPPMEWPVNGFLFEDPVSKNWYLYAGNYAAGYALGADKQMVCTVYRSTDKGGNWEALGPIFNDKTFCFEGDAGPSNFAPDVSVTYYEGRYHLVYDWVNDSAAWADLANPDDTKSDSGVGYAWAERPEGPFTRATTPVKRTSEQPLLCDRYRRLYASTLIRRENDWLILTLTDSGPYFAWALLGMTAPTPEGPWSDLVPLLHVDQQRYLPPLLEYFPAFTHDGYIYAPATSVAKNRNYQALFRVPIEDAMSPEAWENVAWGGVWHAEPVPNEHAGIWGQTFSGFANDDGQFTVMFPSRTAENLGTLNLAQRSWDKPYREEGFVLSGHGAPSLGLLKNAYDEFAVSARLTFTGMITLVWNYTAPLGANRPTSDATLHPLSLASYQGLVLSGETWQLVSVNESGQPTVHTSGSISKEALAVEIQRNKEGHVTITLNENEILSIPLSAGFGALGLLAHENSIAEVLQYLVSGEPIAAELSYLYTEGLLGAGQNMAFWQEVADPAFRFGTGAISKKPDPGAMPPVTTAKWNVECSAFQLWAPRHPEYGQADLYLDRTLLDTIDFSAPSPETSAIRYTSTSMFPGYHFITLIARNGILPLDCLEVSVPAYPYNITANTSLNATFPIDGDVLNRNDGEETDAGLTVEVTGTAPYGKTVYVNDTVAQRYGDTFSCPVLLTEHQETIVINTDDEIVESRVFYNKGSKKRYRFSVDDNIQFLKDLGTAPEQYPSLFDHWYLAFWQEMHRKYGAKIHLNIYYQTDGFDLTQMPDKWKEEWRANADWLHVTFHALQDKPDRPYRNATYSQIAHDYDLVTGHIRRFAGEELIGNTTTVHWAECPKDGVYALRDRGIRNLIALFGTHEGAYRTSYYLSPEQSARSHFRPAWHDHDTGITFIPCAVVVNSFSPEKIKQILQERSAIPQTADVIELLVHEQYFRKELDLYQPDIMDKVRAALDWVTDNGYEPVFWSEGFLGTPQP